MDWLPLVQAALVAVLLALVPGVVVTWAAGLRGFFAVALAPVVSVSLIATAAIVGAPLEMLWWGLVPVLTIGLAAAAWGIDRFSTRRSAPSSVPGRGWGWLPWVTGLAVSVVLWSRHMRNILKGPENFSQTFDNVWHLSAIRHILDTGNASSLTLARLNATEGMPTFYPAAFHDLVALLATVHPTHLTVAVNAVACAIVSVVWPLSVMVAVRATWAPHPATIATIGVLAASFPSFPVQMLDFGVLYPNVLGYALVPAMVGLGVQWLGLGRDTWLPWHRCVTLGVIGAPGVALSHPNAVVAILLVAVPLLVWFGVRTIVAALRSERRPVATAWRLAAAATGIALILVVWPLLQPPVALEDWPPPLKPPAAVGHAVTNTSVFGLMVWVPSLLMVLGMAVAARRRLGWLVLVWAVVAATWVVISSEPPGEFRHWLTAAWYQDSIRFSSTLALVAVPLAALGLDQLVRRLVAATSRSPLGARRARSPWATAVISVLVVGALVLGTQATTSMNRAIHDAAALYRLGDDSPLVDSDEFALLQRLDSLVPPDAVIAVNPWTGAALAYAISGREVVFPHILYGDTPERVMIREHLDEVATNPAVCPVLRSERVTYALDFGPREIHNRRSSYAGFDRLDRARGFELVDEVGHAKLFRITACD